MATTVKKKIQIRLKDEDNLIEELEEQGEDVDWEEGYREALAWVLDRMKEEEGNDNKMGC